MFNPRDSSREHHGIHQFYAMIHGVSKPSFLVQDFAGPSTVFIMKMFFQVSSSSIWGVLHVRHTKSHNLGSSTYFSLPCVLYSCSDDHWKPFVFSRVLVNPCQPPKRRRNRWNSSLCQNQIHDSHRTFCLGLAFKGHVQFHETKKIHHRDVSNAGLGPGNLGFSMSSWWQKQSLWLSGIFLKWSYFTPFVRIRVVVWRDHIPMIYQSISKSHRIHVMLYMLTFTINILQMFAFFPIHGSYGNYFWKVKKIYEILGSPSSDGKFAGLQRRLADLTEEMWLSNFTIYTYCRVSLVVTGYFSGIRRFDGVSSVQLVWLRP